MEMRRGRKEVDLFPRWNLFLENNRHTTCFYFIFTNIYSRKNDLYFPSKNTHKLKDLELYQFRWTTY